MHFSTFEIPETGEGTIDDLVLFSTTGRLAHVERQWTAVKSYALLVDQCHCQALTGVRSFVAGAKKPLNEDELDALYSASMELEALSDSDSVIVKSLIFSLLNSFHEYVFKQVQRLIDPQNPIEGKRAYLKIHERLKAKGLLDEMPADYEAHFDRFRDSVRNNLAHGDWSELSQELHALDLTKAFLAQAGLCVAMAAKLRELGHDV